MSQSSIRLAKHLRLVDKNNVGPSKIQSWLVYNIKNQTWNYLDDNIRKKSNDICIKYRDTWNNTKYYLVKNGSDLISPPYPFNGSIVSLPEFPVESENRVPVPTKNTSTKKQFIERYRNIVTILPCLNGDRYHLLLCGSPPLSNGRIFYQFPNISLIVNTACRSSKKDKPAMPGAYNSEGVFKGKIECDVKLLDIRTLRNTNNFFDRLFLLHRSIYKSLRKGDVVIHCLMGQHRSVFTLISYWMWLHVEKNQPYPFQRDSKIKRVIDSSYQYLMEYRPIVEARNFPTLLNAYMAYLVNIS